jgi:hypothetical protein
VTKVTRISSIQPLLLLSLAVTLFAAPCGWAQSSAVAIPASSSAVVGTTAPREHSAQALYLQLQTAGLDKSRVYAVREVSLDRAAFHITFDDGIIAFTEDVAGRVTGAFFEGEGEVLLVPRDQAERASMALFTGAAILEERFGTAYFRFNDDTFRELQPALRPAENSAELVTRWNETARHLAEIDALRLLLSFSQFLPAPDQGPTQGAKSSNPSEDDRMLHARMQGRNLGAFDLYFDSLAAEQVWAGQLKTAEGENYYDVWTSFSLGQTGVRAGDATGALGEDTKLEAINVSQYKVQAQVEPPTKLDADASLQLEVRQGGQRAVIFELSRFLQIKRVEADGQPVEFIHNQALEGTQLSRQGNDLVAVIFPRALRTGQKIELHFVYGGEVLSEAGGGLLYVGARGTWYPNRGLEMSRFDLRFRYPVGWTLVATGKFIESAPVDMPPGQQESHWASERPVPLAGFNLGKYSRVTARAGDVQVGAYATSGVERAFPKAPPAEEPPRQPLAPFPLRRRPDPIAVATLPPSPARNAQAVADLSARAVEFFARRFGPYPYTSLSLTQMPGDLSQGWPSLIFLSSFSFLTPDEKSQLRMTATARSLSNSVIAHETAHQWWGDLISWKSYRDQWLFEALANYSSLMMLETDSPAQFHAVLEKYRQDLVSKNQAGSPVADAGPVTLGTRLSSSRFPAGYDTVTYGRGTWLLHMLRSMMRDADRKGARHSGNTDDEPFVRALRKVRERYQEKSINTPELLHVFEEDLPPSLWFEGKKSLDWFYRGWVNGTALPRLDLQAVKFVEKAGVSFVTGTITQTGSPSDLVTAVPVYAVLSGKTLLLGQVFADGAETSFRLSAPAGTRKVILDPYRTVLTRPR